MYNLIRSNRVEVLADALIERLAEPIDDPLRTVWTVVPHREMGQWLARRMARRHGVCANQPFLLAAAAMWRLLRAVNDAIPAVDSYSQQALVARTWAGVLDAAQHSDPLLAPLQRYLQTSDDGARMRFVRQLAALFDQYMVYRPQWLIDWETQAPAHWQAWLWKRMASDRPWHWARCWHWLMQTDRLSAGATAPAQIRFFALPMMSPSYLDCVARLSTVVPVTIYHWTPTAGFLGDIESPRGRRRSAQAAVREPAISPLLASMAQPHRDISDLLLDYPAQEEDLFDSPDASTLLELVQRDLLDELWLPNRQPGDDSVIVQRCSSPQREAEICRDELLRRFDADPSLMPDDVLVVCPSLDRYLPALTSAFGPPAASAAILPWRLLGVSAGQELSATSAVLALLATLRHQPLDRSVLDLLRFPAIRRRFGLPAQGQVDRMRWLRAAGLFFNRPENKFSWATAMDRWVDALVCGNEQMPVSPDEVHAVGQLAQFLITLDGWTPSLAGERPLSGWLDWLQRLSRSLLQADESEQAELSQQTQPMFEMVQACDAPMTFAAFAELCRGMDSQTGSGHGRVGYMTVATPEAARLLPATGIMILGITDGQFPAAQDRSELNLMHQNAAQPGDRIRRAEHRLMFLEWLCSARRWISISGCSIDSQSGQPLSMSSVCSELAAALEQRIGAQVCQTHPLQPFSRRYGLDRTGYAHFLNVERPLPANPLAGVVVTPPARERIELTDLTRFWQLPARWFLRETLGLWLDLPDEQLASQPPLEPNALSRYQHLQALLGAPVPAASTLARQVTFPEGPMGEAHAQAAVDDALRLQQQVQELTRGRSGQSRPLAARIDGWQVGGILDQLYADHRIVVSAGKAKEKRILALWLQHLLLNHVDGPHHSTLLATDRSITLPPVADPLPHLQWLVGWFVRGQSVCLPFFPATSRAYCKKSDQPQAALAAARALFLPARQEGRPEGADSYVDQIWPGGDGAFDSPFVELATGVWQPLEASLKS